MKKGPRSIVILACVIALLGIGAASPDGHVGPKAPVAGHVGPKAPVAGHVGPKAPVA
jgi:hypothetical protein